MRGDTMNSDKMFDERLNNYDNLMWWCVKILFVTAMIGFIGWVVITTFLEWLA